MINLKLAEYKEGKFEKYLELGKDFLYGGDSIFFHNPNNQHLYKWQDDTGLTRINYELDEKDPLNRFDGLFDGRTYGDGRFVLIDDEFNHFYQIVKCSTRTLDEFYGYLGNAKVAPFELEYKSVGNLFENPELWWKVK